jgi:DNA-binding GntR family transcriptional regulator
MHTEATHTIAKATSKIPLTDTLQIMQQPSENEKTPIVVIKKIREAILDEVFKPGDWLPELDLAAKFQVSRSPVREALLFLEREGTVITEPHKGARVRPLSAKETLDIAEIRLDLLTFAIKTAHRQLSSSELDPAYELAKQITQSNSAKEQYECNHRFWDRIFETSRRPVRREIFRQLDDRTTRYYPLTIRLFPDPKSRPRQGEVLIEFYRKGNVEAAIGAFKKAYLDVVHQIIDSLEA